MRAPASIRPCEDSSPSAGLTSASVLTMRDPGFSDRVKNASKLLNEPSGWSDSSKSTR
jgi:hypothetical protein